MEEYIRKLRGPYQQLNARGQLVTDEDLANTLLTSLPETWSLFITTLNATGMLITSEILIARILNEDWSRRAGTAWQTALKAQGAGKKSNGGQSGSTKGKCQNWGKRDIMRRTAGKRVVAKKARHQLGSNWKMPIPLSNLKKLNLCLWLTMILL